MPNLGGPELIIIALVFVLLFGAKKLPELGSSVGKSIKNFKKGIDEAREGDEADTDEDSKADEKQVNSSS
jgi:sec-independent protein translocase protein TatA